MRKRFFALCHWKFFVKIAVVRIVRKEGIVIKVIVKITVVLMSYGGAFLPVESIFLIFG